MYLSIIRIKNGVLEEGDDWIKRVEVEGRVDRGCSMYGSVLIEMMIKSR